MEYVKMKCTECKRINYWLPKSRAASLAGSGGKKKKLVFKKYCKWDRKHTIHQEA